MGPVLSARSTIGAVRRKKVRGLSWAKAVIATVVVACCVAVGLFALSLGAARGSLGGEREGAEIYERGLTADGWPSVDGVYSPDGGLAEPAWRL